MGSLSEALSTPSRSRVPTPIQSRTNSPRAAETDTAAASGSIKKTVQQLLDESPMPRQESNIDSAPSESEALESLKIESEKIVIRPLRPKRPDISASDPYTRHLVQQLLTGDKSTKIYDETLRRLAETTDIIQKEIDLRLSLKITDSIIKEDSDEEDDDSPDNKGDNVDSDLSDEDK